MANIRWVRVVLLAVALEAALFAALLPIQPLMSKNAWIAVVAAACAIFAYVTGWLVARGLTSGAALNGLLVGVLATLIYLGLNIASSGGLSAATAFYGTTLFVVINALRIVGCLAGSLTSRDRKAANAARHSQPV